MEKQKSKDRAQISPSVLALKEFWDIFLEVMDKDSAAALGLDGEFGNRSTECVKCGNYTHSKCPLCRCAFHPECAALLQSHKTLHCAMAAPTFPENFSLEALPAEIRNSIRRRRIPASVSSSSAAPLPLDAP